MLDIHIDGLVFMLQTHGGISRCFENLIRCLGSRDDVNVTLYLPFRTNWLPQFQESIKIIMYPVTISLRPGRLFQNFNNFMQSRAIERMWVKIDRGVFHSTHYSTYDSLRIPQAFTLHDMIYEILPECFEPQWHQKHVEEKLRCAKAADAVICDSRSALEGAERFYCLSDKITTVVPFAADSEFCRIDDAKTLSAFRQKHVGGKHFVLYVGARYAHKNFVGLLAAYARWHGRNQFQLLAIGGGVPSAQELSIIHGLGIRGNVSFCPKLDGKDMVVAYNAAGVLVMPSLCEGFGFPVIEAMACGTPVAAARAGSLPEVGGETPVYFDPRDGNQIVDAIEKAIQIPRDSDRILAGIQRAKSRDWEQVTDEYVQIYKDIAFN